MILAASLAEGRSLIRRPATNDDAQALIACCRALGAEIEETPEGLRIEGVAGRPRNPGVLNPGNAGAVARFLIAVACLAEGEVRIETDHAESLGRRPNRELVEALRSLGAEIEATGPEACLPIRVRGGRDRLRAGTIRVEAFRSSQFLSALLFLAPHLRGASVVEVAGPGPAVQPRIVSRPLIDQTLEVLAAFGAGIDVGPEGFRFGIKGPRRLRAGDHEVHGDWPSAAALMSAVAVAGGMAALDGLADDAQGERRARPALAAMGCEFQEGEGGRLFIHSRGELAAECFNGDLATDAVLALEAAACLAHGASRFENIANLRLKESDRIGRVAAELSRLGVAVRHGADWVEITGNPEGYPGGIEVEAHGDHRLAQMLAVIGLRCERGLVVRGADCVSKSYPGFFEDLARLGAKARRLPLS